jgi:hypothetical protein
MFRPVAGDDRFAVLLQAVELQQKQESMGSFAASRDPVVLMVEIDSKVSRLCSASGPEAMALGGGGVLCRI